MSKLRPVHIDGALYFFAAMFTAAQAAFTSNEAYQYVNPYLLYWLRTLSGILGAGVLAVKMYRSPAVANDRKEPKP